MGHALTSCNKADICKAWQKTFDNLKAHGETPNLHMLDNECSKEMKLIFQDEGVEY